MKNKKGQTQQVFIYIMVILVVGGVLLFGYKAINNTISEACNVDLVTFQSELKGTFEKYNSYGDNNPVSMKSPCGYEFLCFINSSTAAITGESMALLTTISEAAADEVKAGTGNNVFLIKSDETKPLYALDYLEVNGNETVKGFLCVDTKSSNFDFVLEGMGRGRVSVTEGR